MINQFPENVPIVVIHYLRFHPVAVYPPDSPFANLEPVSGRDAFYKRYAPPAQRPLGKSVLPLVSRASPLDLFESYMQSFTDKSIAPKVEMIAIDCVDSPASRIKMYLRTSVTTLAGARDTYTLRDRLDGETVEAGLDAMGQLWRILFRLDALGDIDDVDVLPAGSYCGFAVEMKPGRARPKVKMHIPKAFPRHGLDETNGTHTFVSFAYTAETGVYITMCYSTKIFGPRVQEDIWKGYDDLWATERIY
ncbi:hypothetical protein MFIFM68171_06654 [Madurella fahalii]|uniref:Uncharacterized protein n=1 Tax=Madurella fahalii TaxID=1157608 RepID=A0ABQ0GFD7_9PEZI